VHRVRSPGQRQPNGSAYHSPVNRIATFTGDDSEVEDGAYEEIG
jgi:hypothetical protein